jgi:predicted tellurium resistance membrane protein TerC
MDFSVFATSAGWISLLTLTFMEVILGIDNIIFVAINTQRTDPKNQEKARFIGLLMALLIRILLLFFIKFIIESTEPLFVLPINFEGNEISLKDMVLFLGGLFLLYKSTVEIHHKLEVDEHVEEENKTYISMQNVILQIAAINLVFSIDSIVTAIGLTQSIVIMMFSILLSMLIMVIVSKSISNFIEKHPTVKMLALSFLLMIGMMLVVEAFEIHVPKGYVYFAMAFSLIVEVLNIRLRTKSTSKK